MSAIGAITRGISAVRAHIATKRTSCKRQVSGSIPLTGSQFTPLNAESHANLPPAILVTNGFDPLRDVGHAYAQKLAAAGNDLTYVHNPDLTHGFPQFTRYSAACDQATTELADLIKARIG